jgi:methyltransferase (TIGR00027 family)
VVTPAALATLVRSGAMRAGRSSLTAAFVAAGRGLGVDAQSYDPTASALLPRTVAAMLRRVHRGGPAGNVVRGLGRLASLGLVDHVNLRTAAIDAAVVEAIERGCDQLVILGAGLDGRAWRLEALAGVDVFEVDHPDTQIAKRNGVERMRSEAASVRFVAVDFERQRLGARLRDAGHDGARPTMWIWEGVTPYLPGAAIEATLADVGELSTTGSSIAMTYAIPTLVPIPSTALRRVTRLAFAALGEPLMGAMEPALARRRLAAAGFGLCHDTDARQWAQLGPGDPLLAIGFRGERLAVAMHDA